MNCEQAHALIGALHDEELDVVQQVEVESHVRGCARCSAQFDTLVALRSAIRAASPRYQTPPELIRRLAAAGGREPWRSGGRPSPWIRRTAMAAAAMVLLAIGVAAGIMIDARRPAMAPGGAEAILQDAVAAHARSLMAEHLVDVVSSDRHTVKPWFEGKLDFSPPVIDLAAQGFPLIGGRLDHVAGHTAAAIVYRRRLHTINLLVWPADSHEVDAEPRTKQLQGYSVIQWQQDGFDFIAVSTVNMDDLKQFVALLRDAPTTQQSR